MFKHAFDANWKVYFENLCDAAHPLFVHRSSIDAAQQQSDQAHSDGSGTGVTGVTRGVARPRPPCELSGPLMFP